MKKIIQTILVLASAVMLRLGWIRLKVMAMTISQGGGLITDLAAAIQAFESLGGAWSMTLTRSRDPEKIEVNLLRVGLERPQWKGPGFRQPRSDAPAKAIIEAKMVFLGKPEDLVKWLHETRNGINVN